MKSQQKHILLDLNKYKRLRQRSALTRTFYFLLFFFLAPKLYKRSAIGFNANTNIGTVKAKD